MEDETRRVTLNVSLYPRHVKAVRWAARETGSTSSAVGARRLIEEGMRVLIGPNWADQIEADAPETEPEAVTAA
jgi:hypothetical protein